MVSAVLADALSDPLAVLYSLKASNGSDDTESVFAGRVATSFRAIFKNEHTIKQIPALDISHPPETYAHQSHPLVRFRAMVQDTSASQELYPFSLSDGRPGGWGLAETLGSEGFSEPQNLREREVVWAVSIPGESPFVGEYLDDISHEVTESTHNELTPDSLRHKDPLLRGKHLGVQIKIYNKSFPNLKPTEVHTFVGFFTFEHASLIENLGIENTPFPTLHLVFSVGHPRCLLQFPYPLSSAPDPTMEVQGTISSVRDGLIKWISDEALCGDTDAAEWVLIALIARVESRNPPLFPPSLEISRFPKPDIDSVTPALVHVLRYILPLFVDVPLSLPLLNTRPFAPESRNESLRAGLLQLPAGTTVLLSDNGLQEGKLTETGIRNIQALRTCIVSQTLDYQFPFAAPYQFPTDLSFLVLTEGRKSAFVEVQLNIPLEPKVSGGCFKAPEKVQLPPPSQLEAYRRLVGGAKIGQVHVTEEVSQYIQEDFVRERQENRMMTAEVLMRRVSVARLMALSQHEKHLSKDLWQRAKELDERRMRRS